jgi:hypothetical protein
MSLQTEVKTGRDCNFSETKVKVANATRNSWTKEILRQTASIMTLVQTMGILGLPRFQF